MRKALVFLISMYQYLISPFYSPCCRFTPSCSEYVRQAIMLHGAFRGMALGLWRIIRCHPLCAGGYDPVPLPNPSKRDVING